MRLFAGTKYDQPPTCERCGKLEADCRCPPLPRARVRPSAQVARLNLEKRKKGKVVTVVRGLSAADNDLPSLLSNLKSRCGAGGTVEQDQLEIQGDHVERLRDILQGLGYRVRE